MTDVKSKRCEDEGLKKISNLAQLAFSWVISDHENCIDDGYEDEMPSKEELMAEICVFFEKRYSIGLEDELRRAGKQYLMECIEDLLEADGF